MIKDKEIVDFSSTKGHNLIGFSFLEFDSNLLYWENSAVIKENSNNVLSTVGKNVKDVKKINFLSRISEEC